MGIVGEPAEEDEVRVECFGVDAHGDLSSRSSVVSASVVGASVVGALVVGASRLCRGPASPDQQNCPNHAAISLGSACPVVTSLIPPRRTPNTVGAASRGRRS